MALAHNVRALARSMDLATGELWRTYRDIADAAKSGLFYAHVQAVAATRRELTRVGFTVESDECDPGWCWVHW